MRQPRQILNRILFPHLALVIASVPLSAALLIYTFSHALETGPVAYASYLISAYSLTVVCARFTKVPRGGFRRALHRNPYVHRYLTDVPFKTHVSLYLSLGLNLLFAAVKLFFGVRYGSIWYGTLAVYYVLLATMRFLLLRHVKRNALGQEPASELRQYRLCGIILMLMNVALAGVMVLVMAASESFHYAGYLIYVVSMYAFYNVITAVRDVYRGRLYNSPVMSAARAVKLAAALVSILALETAMLAQFDEGSKPHFRQFMVGLTGGAVCLTILAVAGVMVARSTRQLKRMRSGAESRKMEEMR